jgi:hypothetical protein
MLSILNGTQQLLASACDVNLLAFNMDTTKKNTESLIVPVTSKEIDLEVKAEKTKGLLLSLRQNAAQNPDMKTAKDL